MNQFGIQISKEIDSIRNNINSLNTILQQKNNFNESKIVETKKKQTKSNHRTYALTQFLNKQKYIQYKKDEKLYFQELESDFSTSVNEIKDMDQFMNTLNKSSYCKKWCYLDNWQKKQVLQQYLQQLVISNQITQSQSNNLLNLFTPSYLKKKSFSY